MSGEGEEEMGDLFSIFVFSPTLAKSKIEKRQKRLKRDPVPRPSVIAL